MFIKTNTMSITMYIPQGISNTSFLGYVDNATIKFPVYYASHMCIAVQIVATIQEGRSLNINVVHMLHTKDHLRYYSFWKLPNRKKL